MVPVFLFVACSVETAVVPTPGPGPKPSPSAPAPAPAEDDEPKGFQGTVGVVEKPASGSGSATLENVKATSKKGFDRVVFELSGGIPGYHLAYVDKPVRNCGSGEPVPVAGDAWLEVRLTPSAAHTAEGKPTIGFQELPLDLGVMRELQQTCDFEGVVTWVIGVGSPKGYRVVAKSDPPRLMVDIEH